MNLYLVERSDRYGYDEYDSLVVSARSHKAALTIPPDEYNGSSTNSFMSAPRTVTYIGKAGKNIYRQGVVLASFNAG